MILKPLEHVFTCFFLKKGFKSCTIPKIYYKPVLGDKNRPKLSPCERAVFRIALVAYHASTTGGAIFDSSLLIPLST